MIHESRKQVGTAPARLGMVAFRSAKERTFAERKATMACLVVLTLFGSAAAHAAPPAKSADDAERQKTTERLQEVFTADARDYRLSRDKDNREPLEWQSKPVYIWVNPIREGGQQGSVFVWTYRGCPEALGSTFSHRGEGGRIILHEFHTLSPGLIYQHNQTAKPWQPREGLARVPLRDAPVPAEGARQRLVQIRSLSREFSAHSIDHDGGKWELRILPQPLYRYESKDPEVVDGALLAFVTDAGTDPEILLLLEARQTRDGARWHYGLARFSDYALYVNLGEQQVWSAVRDSTEDTWEHDAPRRYQLHKEKVIPLEPEPKK